MFKRFLCLSLIGVLSLIAVKVEAGPAPPLTYLQVYAARSEKWSNYEYFTPNQCLSKQDHGGKWMHIVTKEIGYGYSRYATMNGSNLKLIRIDPIHLDADRIVDGWMCYWDASGHQGGMFKYKNTSCNYPWNTLYDSINIK